MNPEIKARWIEALRSGWFAQGENALSEDDKFCCLGILCELAAAQGIVRREGGGSHIIYRSEGDFEDYSGTVLPTAVKDWAELDDVDPLLGYGTPVGRLRASNWNDAQGAGFAQIADMIEFSL